MEQITAYKTGNGQIFEDYDEAKKEENRISFRKAVWQFANDTGSSNDEIQSIGNAIIDNARELSVLFSKYYHK
jgi:hypothetical protein